jgi:uncharacterized protein YjbJ (UPF0337 family)
MEPGRIADVEPAYPHQKRKIAMNWDIVKGKWKQFTGSAKAQWGKLTEDELQQIDGDREALVGKIQEKYGVARDEAEKEVDKWAKNA